MFKDEVAKNPEIGGSCGNAELPSFWCVCRNYCRCDREGGVLSFHRGALKPMAVRLRKATPHVDHLARGRRRSFGPYSAVIGTGRSGCALSIVDYMHIAGQN